MEDPEFETLKEWRYVHGVKQQWDVEAPTARFSVQVENVIEELQETEDLEVPFSIEADIRIVSAEESEKGERRERSEGTQNSLTDWGR